MAAASGTVVVALGGNALSPPGIRASIHDQFHHTRQSLRAVVELIREGWRVVIVHGNGPQVGQELSRHELAIEVVEPLPLGVLVASTSGWIGYMVQQCLLNALQRAGLAREVMTVITQTVVDRRDPRFDRPTKPIGNALSPERADALRARGVPLGTDRSGRVRRLAPSPPPIDIVELAVIRHLVERGIVVIAGGGGGAPVYWDEATGWEGVDAVVDKDSTAAILGARLGADTLLILTDVPAVYRGWGTAHAEPLLTLGHTEAMTLLEEDELGTGSMAPKVRAAVDFVERGGRRAVITHLAQGLEALDGVTGTTITAEER